MAYREIAPHPALRPFVDRFWLLTSGADAPARRILPDGCIDLILDLTLDPTSMLGGGGGAVVVGTMTRALVFEPRAPVRSLGVRFRPAGAAPFLKIAADALTDRVATCDELGARWLTSAVAGPGDGAGAQRTADPIAAAGRLERCLLQRLAATRAPDALVAHAAARLFDADPPSIAALTRETGRSRQHLARLFRSQVGVSPKQLARVARLQRAVASLHLPGGGGELADTAAGLGYFDQAHMNRDFRELAGVTPGAARAAAGSIFPIRSLLDGG